MTYPSDLNDERWELIKDHFNTGNYGKSRKYTQRLLVNGVLMLLLTCLPKWRAASAKNAERLRFNRLAR